MEEISSSEKFFAKASSAAVMWRSRSILLPILTYTFATTIPLQQSFFTALNNQPDILCTAQGTGFTDTQPQPADIKFFAHNIRHGFSQRFKQLEVILADKLD